MVLEGEEELKLVFVVFLVVENGSLPKSAEKASPLEKGALEEDLGLLL